MRLMLASNIRIGDTISGSAVGLDESGFVVGRIQWSSPDRIGLYGVNGNLCLAPSWSDWVVLVSRAKPPQETPEFPDAELMQLAEVFLEHLCLDETDDCSTTFLMATAEAAHKLYYKLDAVFSPRTCAKCQAERT